MTILTVKDLLLQKYFSGKETLTENPCNSSRNRFEWRTNLLDGNPQTDHHSQRTHPVCAVWGLSSLVAPDPAIPVRLLYPSLYLQKTTIHRYFSCFWSPTGGHDF